MRYLDQRIDEHGEILRFEGFPRTGLEFLKKLRRNNRRDWFQARKAEYEALLVQPMRRLVGDLADRLAEKVPGMRFDPKRAVFRIYRDVRFSEDKSPYKTHIAAHMSYPAPDRATGPGFYLHVEPGRVIVGGGLYMPTAEQLKRIRLRINDEPAVFAKLIGAPSIRREFGGMGGEPLKRAPKGWPADHPHLELLKMKQYFAGSEVPDSAILKRDFVKLVARKLSHLVPLVRWLQATVGRR